MIPTRRKNLTARILTDGANLRRQLTAQNLTIYRLPTEPNYAVS